MKNAHPQSPTSVAPPPTLLEMLGVSLPAATLGNAVLLIIDAQREYVDGRLPLAGIAASLAVGGRLLARARAAGTPVVHVLHRGGGPLFDLQASGGQAAAPLLPENGEAVVYKSMANAFAGTDLLSILQQSGRQQLIVIGYMTHNCVSSTVRAALDLGYRSTVVAAATATRDLPDGLGGCLPAASVQAASLAGLADTIARIVGDDADIPD